MQPTIKATTEVVVRFNEVDSLAIVWHGHYLKYFEDAREAFGREYGLGYLDVFNNGFVTPLVNIGCDFKKPLVYGDKAIVEATFINTPAAKIHFEFKVFNAATMELAATGSSTQVFLVRDTFELYMTVPEFFAEWKKKVGLE